MANWFKEAEVKTLNGTSVATGVFREAASQSFKKGDFLSFTGGRVQLLLAANATYGSADVDSAGAGAIVGMALHDASGTTDNLVRVALANENNLFLLPVVHGTPASAVTAVSQIGTSYDLAHFSLNSVSGWGCTIDDTTEPNVVVVELERSMPVGEQYGRVWVKVLSGRRHPVSA